MSFRPIIRALILILLASITVLAGCGAQPTAENAPSVTPTPTPTATPSPTATATPSPTPVMARTCGKDFPTTTETIVGGLMVAQRTIFGNLAYPATTLPDNLPLTPYLVPLSNGSPHLTGMPINPNLYEGGGGYVIAICNSSTAPHTVKRIDVRIDAISPVSGTPNEAPACMGGAYSRQYGAGNGGCGGADFENEYMHAPFAPSAGVGTTVTATQTGTNTCAYATGCTTNYGPLPVTLKPGQWMTIEVGMGSSSSPAFTTPGYYTFSFGVGVDGATPVFAATSPKTLLDPSTRQWTGKACQSPTMQAQIPPATNPPSYYLCPAS